MFKFPSPSSIPRLTSPATITNLTRRTFTTSPRILTASPKMEAFKKAGNRADAPPKHEMIHFPGLMSEKRSFGDFRTVLHTGLFSQIVAMEVPVGGDIGDEVNYAQTLKDVNVLVDVKHCQ